MRNDGADGPLIVGIGGSTGAASNTNLLLRRCLELLTEQGARARTFDGARLAELPIYGSQRRSGDGGVAELVEAVRDADGVVIATPGYHGGMSGLVKNGLDHLEALRTDARPYLDGRAVGVIVNAAGWQACGTTLVSVRSAIHALRGWPTPFGVTVNSVEQAAEVDGRIDARVEGALSILAGQILRFAHWQRGASVRSD